MATIGKIRKNSTLLLIMIGGALLLFVLSDFLGTQGGGNRQEQPEIAKIGKEKISARDFFNKLDNQMELYKLQFGDNITPATAFQIREEVFNEVVRQTILQKEYEKIGLTVSPGEILDMMTGVNIHPIIKQNFTDPQTGQFNPENVVRYIQNLGTLEVAQQNQWKILERIMIEERYFNKYQTLVQKSFFVPKAMQTDIHKMQNQFASADYITLKYSDIKDEDIKLTDADFEKWYKENKFKYEQPDDSRWLQYIIFDVLPNEEDLKLGIEKVNEINNNFIQISAENTRDNFVFASLNSDLDFKPDTGFMKRTELPARADTIFNMPIGSTFGPYNEANSYYIFKVLDRKERPDSLRASHILVAYRGAMRVDPAVTRTKDEAKLLADSLLTVVKGFDSTNFATVALQFSNDQSANQAGGDLGWFLDGNMVPEFNEACINANVNDFFVVESAFGFHVVKLTGKKAIEKQIKVAQIKHTIEASTKTQQVIFAEASKIAGASKDAADFEKRVLEANLNLRNAEFVRKSDFSIPGINEGREIVRWAFNADTEEGMISQVFDLINENKNVVVALKRIRERGIPPLEQLKDQIEIEVKKMKKAENLTKKVEEALKNTNNINDLATKLNTNVAKVEFVNLNSPNLPGIGPEPKVVGTLYGTELNKMSRIIIGSAGIFVVVPTNFTEVPAATDLTMVEASILNMFRNRVSHAMFNALLKKANVKDNRIFYY